MNLVGIIGIPIILGIGVLLSTDRKAIKPRLIAWGLGIQIALALFILKTQVGIKIFQFLGTVVNTLLHYSNTGAGFIFNDLVKKPESFGFIFAFQVLPAIIFVGALMNIAYYLGIMQLVVTAIAKVMVKTLGTSGAESLSAVGTVFVGQSEAPLLIKPYIPEMTRSELMAIMTGGMATIAGSVMAAYIGMLGSEWAPQLLAASIMGAPAGLVMAKLLVPETEEPKTAGEVKMSVEKTESSVIEAASKGALDGMHLAFIVGALLIAFIALIDMINGALASKWAGPFLSICILYPIAVKYWAKLTGQSSSAPITPISTTSEDAVAVNETQAGSTEGEQGQTAPTVQEKPIAPPAPHPVSTGTTLGFLAAFLLAFVLLSLLLRLAVDWVASHTGQQFSLQLILGYLFSPLTFVMGVPRSDILTVGGLIGQKIVLNEFVAYSELSNIMKGTGTATLTEQGKTIATFALCGFANFASIGINIGCIGGIAPERRGELAILGPRAMLGGALASCLTATIAGLLVG